MRYVPGAVPGSVSMIKVAESPGLTTLGEKWYVIPLIVGPAVSCNAPEKPWEAPVVSGYVTEPPAITESKSFPVDRLKSGVSWFMSAC